MPRTPDNVSDATLRLLLAEGLGPVTLRKLRERFGNDDDAIVNAPISALDQIEGVGRTLAESLKRAVDRADIDAERAAMRKHGAMMTLLDDADYPPLL
jgi:predicted Rossmann fold nucleotide-binding protein DprA/Smf involved in DNA uptake